MIQNNVYQFFFVRIGVCAYFIYQFLLPLYSIFTEGDIQWLTTVLLVMTYGSESSKGPFLKNANHALRVIIIRLAIWVCNMKQILRCDWLPVWARWCHLASSGLPAMRRKEIVFFFHMTNLLLTKLVIFFRVYKTSTLSHSLNTRKTTWPISWLHGWSVTENKKWIVRHLATVFYSITLVLFQKIT